ncbi:MAG: hypothetical protein GY789_22910 [Hyphomicrobiales bacterium]|nr:hypothetical protein [Hyphomicrobiales bacterium]MCP5000397.1 hypothetical protein [Hyphomicrobiales bacterium]
MPKHIFTVPLPALLLGLRTVVPGSCISPQARAAEKPLPTYLQSGSGDLIRLQKGSVPSDDALDVPLAPDGSETGLEDAIEMRLVTVCLKNPADMHRTKAFDINRTGLPRFPVRPGGQVCAKLEPTRHTVYFWKSDAAGALLPTLSSRLDLNDADGTLINLTWVQE